MNIKRKVTNHYNNIKYTRDNEELKKYLKDIPDKLYKYREFNDNNLDALINDYIWMSTANKFMDKEDSILKLRLLSDKNEFENLFIKNIDIIILSIIENKIGNNKIIKETIKKNLSEDKIMKAKAYIDKEGKIHSKKIEFFLKESGCSNNKAKKIIKQIDNLNRKQTHEEIRKNVMNSYLKINKEVRKLNYIYSFAKRVDINSMWENYSENNHGFCIEYDMSKIKESANFNKYEDLLLIVPIIYSRRLEIDIKNLFEITFLKMNNNLNKEQEQNLEKDIIISLITKKEEYSFEHEWRLLIEKNNMKSNKLHFPFVSAIYLGDMIEDEKINKLVEISKKKKIKVYQRIFNEFLSQYEFIEVEY